MKHWRHREDRKSVRISVRVRTDAGWVDATIRNVSSRGMMLHSLQPLRRNEFVEIARGRSRVVGRIVWSEATSCGLRAQDTVDIAALLANPSDASVTPRTDRRVTPRSRATPVRSVASLDRADEARLLGRAMEKMVMVVAIASVSILAVTSALEAAESPLEQVRTALAPDAG